MGANEMEVSGARRTRVKVKVIRAEGLRAADICGSSDPYVVVHMLTKREDATHPPFKTDVKKKTLTPVWDQEHTFDAVTLSDQLLFQVLDHDDGKKDDDLGSVLLEPFEFRPDGFEGSVPIGEKKRRKMFKKHKSRMSSDGNVIDGAVLWLKIEILPMIRVPEVPRCFVRLESARNLRAADRNGKSDPFCICEVPGKPMSRWRSGIKQKTLHPEWHEEEEIHEYAPGDDIQVQVYDHDRGHSLGNALGKVLISNSLFAAEGFSGELELEGQGAKPGSMLTVMIDVF